MSAAQTNFLFTNSWMPRLGKFLAISRALDSAKRQFWSADKGIVDKNHAGLDAAGDLLAMLDVGRVNRPPRPKGELLANAIASSSSFAGKNRATGPKNSCSEGRIVGRDVGEDRWLHKRASMADAIASREYPCAMSNSFVDLL